MSDNNPYQTPRADLDVVIGDASELEITGPHSVDIGRGASWFFDGYSYFKSNPLGWIGAMIALLSIAVAINLIPFGNLAYNLLNPVFSAGLLLGCHRFAQGGQFEFNDLFAGFSRNRNQLLLIGALMLGLTLMVILVMGVMILALAFAANVIDFSNLSPEALEDQISAVPVAMLLLIALISMALFIPLTMALWFAPALVAISGMDAVPALLLSFKGCLKNILPLMLFGIVASIVTTLSAIPLGLGLLVTMPMMSASLYIAYREIFTG